MLEENNGNGGPPKRPRPGDGFARLHPASKREDRLTALAELYAFGALSQAEYELHRNEVLDEL